MATKPTKAPRITRTAKAVQQALQSQGVDAGAVAKAAEQAAKNEVRRQAKVQQAKASGDKVRENRSELQGIDISVLAKSKDKAKAELDRLMREAEADAALMVQTGAAVQEADAQRLNRMLERGVELRQPNASVCSAETDGILGLTAKQQVYIDLLTRDLHRARDGKFNADGKPLKLDASTRTIKSNCAAIIAGCQLQSGKVQVDLRVTDSKGKESTKEQTLTIDDFAKFVKSPPSNLVRSGQSSMFQRAAGWARMIRTSNGLKSKKGTNTTKLLDGSKVISKLEATLGKLPLHVSGVIALLQWGVAQAHKHVPDGNEKVFATGAREWLHVVERVFKEVDAKSKGSNIDTHEGEGGIAGSNVIDMMPEALKRRIAAIYEERKADNKPKRKQVTQQPRPGNRSGLFYVCCFRSFMPLGCRAVNRLLTTHHDTPSGVCLCDSSQIAEADNR
jgi:hypothetical protein